MRDAQDACPPKPCDELTYDAISTYVAMPARRHVRRHQNTKIHMILRTSKLQKKRLLHDAFDHYVPRCTAAATYGGASPCLARRIITRRPGYINLFLRAFACRAIFHDAACAYVCLRRWPHRRTSSRLSWRRPLAAVLVMGGRHAYSGAPGSTAHSHYGPPG